MTVGNNRYEQKRTFNKQNDKDPDHKRRIVAIFINERIVSRKIRELFDTFPEIDQIYDYEIKDINKKIPTHVLTFFHSDLSKLKVLKEKPVTLHKKGTVYYTINGLNNYIGKGTPEENRQVNVDFNEIGHNVILLHTPEGYSVFEFKLNRKYKRNEKYKTNDEMMEDDE